MSLTYAQIEQKLMDGVSFTANEREFTARADPINDIVALVDMTGFSRTTVPLEAIVDRVHATEAGSDLADLNALKRLLAGIVG